MSQVNCYLKQKFVKAIRGLIQKPLRAAIQENVNETEPCSRFIEPLLSEIFDHLNQRVLLTLGKYHDS
ncbi:hypothetical protein BCV71DRAFT_263303 [Rhizopus microsporus]|uniref:Uncharacterized protein n=1 Tax=Rhizopus microsporus TaxID=58291 RepID=A0A1X0S3Z8_RHIZD|nr:hypothetical protein BCV71DRAFT_263303 [Rhizopus microsporus]